MAAIVVALTTTIVARATESGAGQSWPELFLLITVGVAVAGWAIVEFAERLWRPVLPAAIAALAVIFLRVIRRKAPAAGGGLAHNGIAGLTALVGAAIPLIAVIVSIDVTKPTPTLEGTWRLASRLDVVNKHDYTLNPAAGRTWKFEIARRCGPSVCAYTVYDAWSPTTRLRLARRPDGTWSGTGTAQGYCDPDPEWTKDYRDVIRIDFIPDKQADGAIRRGTLVETNRGTATRLGLEHGCAAKTSRTIVASIVRAG
jgi:hypothetical protein